MYQSASTELQASGEATWQQKEFRNTGHMVFCWIGVHLPQVCWVHENVATLPYKCPQVV